MTKEEILKISNVIANENQKLEFQEYFRILENNDLVHQYERNTLRFEFSKKHDFFQKEIKYLIHFEDDKESPYELTNEIIDSLNLFVEMDKRFWHFLGEKAFGRYNECMKDWDDIEYFENNLLLLKHNGDVEAANREFFNFTPKNILEKIGIPNVEILEQNNGHGIISVYLMIFFEAPWDEEHGLKIEFRNSVFHYVE